MKINSLQEKINIKNLWRTVGDFINKKEAWILLVVLSIFIGYCGYLWYQYVYHYQWGEDKKQNYLNDNNVKNIFDKNKFEKVLKEIKSRQEKYNENTDGVRDIFRLK